MDRAMDASPTSNAGAQKRAFAAALVGPAPEAGRAGRAMSSAIARYHVTRSVSPAPKV